MERTSQFYVRVGLIVVRKYSGSCTGIQVMNVSPSSLSLGGILEGYSDSPRVTSRQARLKVKSWTSSRDAIKSTPGTSPPHLSGRTRRDVDCAYVGKGQTKSDQEGKVFDVTSVYTPI